MKRKLPRIKNRLSREIFLTSTIFANLKKKYKKQEEKFLTEEPQEPEFDFEKELELKDDQIINQKQLSDLYGTNFASIFDDLQKEKKRRNLRRNRRI